MSEDEPVGRRAFFRQGLRGLLRPIDLAVAPIERAVRELGKFDPQADEPHELAAPRSVPLELWLRPPGALPEMQFRETCSRCGECVKVCPAQCIKIDPAGVKGAGFPSIEVDAMPCVVCEGLKCMQVCPTGALLPTPLADIDMGTAHWHADTCVRSHGQDCTICVDRCPLGSAAIELKEGNIHVVEDGCIGCGVCQFYCPTSPKSIVVIPKGNQN